MHAGQWLAEIRQHLHQGRRTEQLGHAEARDGWSRIIAGTLGLALFAYVMVNGAMISGLLPVVGVPMPLISYGGTSAVALLAGMGLVMSAGAHGRRPGRG